MERWRTQMSLWCGAVFVFGLVLTGAAFDATSAGVYALFGILDGPGPISYDPVLRFSIALMGAVTLGWGLTALAVVHGTSELPDAASLSLWRMITMAILLWYVIDSGISIATGFWRNAVSNTLLTGWYLVLVARHPARSRASRTAQA